MDKTITITSAGEVLAKPDLINVYLDFSILKLEYAKTMKLSNEYLIKLQESIKEVGFSKSDLKTIDFNINAYYKGYHENNVYKKEFKGYKAYHRLLINLDFDTKLLGDLLNCISKSKTNPNIDINFTIKDKDKLKQELLEDASKKAFKHASILADANNVQLEELISIDYSFASISFESQTRFNTKMDSMAVMSDSIDIVPDDIVVKDNVTFVYKIK